MDYISSDEFPLSAEEVGRFVSQHLTARIDGLMSHVRWSDLSSLLDENYVWDDIIDGCAEITQARQARLGITDRAWISSAFLHSATQLYEQTPRVYNQNLADVRYLVQSGRVTEFFVVHISDSHASVYRWSRTQLLGFGDSLGHAPLPRVIDIMNWVLEGLDVPRLTGFIPIDIPHQPDNSGSCVIACCNVVQRALGTASDIWTHSLSYAFRARMIVDFVKYHAIVEEYGPVRVLRCSATTRCILIGRIQILPSHYDSVPPAAPVQMPACIEDFYSWDEWNLRWPNVCCSRHLRSVAQLT